MYNPDRIIENGVFMDGDKIPRSSMVSIAENMTIDELTSSRDTLEGKFNGQQLRFKKPYVIVEHSNKVTFNLWTTDLGVDF